jgi:hypothetical protein
MHMTRHAARRADELAELAFYLFDTHGAGRPGPFDEQAAELRTAAFRFTREVHGSEPLMVLARCVAGAALELLSQFHTANSAEKLHKACTAYEQARSPGTDASTRDSERASIGDRTRAAPRTRRRGPINFNVD